MSKNTDIEKLESVLIYLVNKSNEIGVYHLNKLTYLFEYFYIKNFGERFTKEYFLKYPHGPVISNYKRIFINLAQREFFLTNTDELRKNRKLTDDYSYGRQAIRSSNKSYFINPLPNNAEILLDNIITKFGKLSVDELETFVYKTEPIINYQNNPYKKETGGYVLESPMINIKKSKDRVPEGIKIALKHMKKYPNFSLEQQKKDYKEFAFMEKLRPYNA